MSAALERFRSACRSAGYKVPDGASRWRMRCPGHDGDGDNLAVASGHDAVILTCHSRGCDAGAIAQAVGLTTADLFDTGRPAPTSPERWRWVDAFPYVDENGALLFEVHRKERGESLPGVKPVKDFPVSHPGADGSRVWGMNGVRRVLFRLPNVIEAVAEERRVLIAEGEKCAIALESLGFTATTTPFGAGGWGKDGIDVYGYAEPLRGAHVVLFPDNDAKGEEHMRGLGRMLERVAASVRVAALPNLREKGDVADWIADGGTHEQLARLLDVTLTLDEWERALEARGALESVPDREEPTSPVESLPFPIPLSEVESDVRLDWSVEELLVAAEIGWVGGDSGVMKTTVAMHVACAIAGGRRAFGRFATREGPVLIVSGEDPEAVLRNRAEALCRGHGWPPGEVLPRMHVLALAGVDLRDAAWQRHLLAIVRELQPVLVLLDPYFELTSGDENSNSDAKPIVRFLRALTQPSDATVLVVHHFKKAAEGVSKTDLFRGASALLKASRMTYTLERGQDGEILVENQKFSRAAKREKFALRATIATDEANEAVWSSARFEYVSADQARFDAAENFVLRTLADGLRFNTSELKEQAKGTRVSGADIARALRSLGMRKLIDFEAGARGAKYWGLPNATLPGNLGKVKNDLAGQGATLPGNLFSEPFHLAPPKGGAGKVKGSDTTGDRDDASASSPIEFHRPAGGHLGVVT